MLAERVHVAGSGPARSPCPTRGCGRSITCHTGHRAQRTSHVSRCTRMVDVERGRAGQVADTLLDCRCKAGVQCWHGMRATQQGAGEVFTPHPGGHPSVTHSNGLMGTLRAATLRGMAAEPTAERLPDHSPDRPRRLGNKAARSDAPQGARGIERFSMRRLKQQKCKVDGKSPYFRSPTKVERASLALRLVVLPPDGPRRRPRCIRAARRREIGRRTSLKR